MNVFEKWQQAAYSGKYINPETEKNMPNTPPLNLDKGQPPEIEWPKEKKERPWEYIVPLAIILIAIIVYFWPVNPQKPIKKQVNRGINVENIVLGVVNGIKKHLPKQQKVKIVRVKDKSQKLAIAKVMAWERVNKAMIKNFYSKNAVSGKRTMCIKYANRSRCTIIDTIDVRPELPGRLRRKANARLDYM